MTNFWKGKKVLVMGAGGFLGSHVVDHLVDQGSKVTAQVSGHKPYYQNLDKSFKKIRIVKGDLLNLSLCLAISKGSDVILNFAAVDGGAAFKREHSVEIFRDNSQITVNTLEAAKNNKVNRILLVSSIVVYPNSAPQPLKEDYQLINVKENVDGYASSKRFLESVAKSYSSQYGLNVGIIRPANVYGPRDSLNKGRVVPTFIKQALENKTISLLNDGKQHMAFIHVDDLARAALDVSEKYAVADPINIGSSDHLSIKELALLIIRLTNSKSKLSNIKSSIRFSDRILHTKKAKKIIGFSQKISIERGLTETIEYFIKNNA